MGFGRMDREAQRLARRSVSSGPGGGGRGAGPWIVAGISVVMVGTWATVIGFSACENRAPSRPAPVAPAPALDPASRRDPTEPAVAPAAPPPIASRPGLPAATAGLAEAGEVGPLGLKLARLDLVLADLDLALHGLRLTWRPTGPSPAWRWPFWVSDLHLAILGRELAALATTEPRVPTLDAAIREYHATVLADAQRLQQLVGAWHAPGASTDALAAELGRLFERLGRVSHTLHAAATTTRAAVPTPVGGSFAALSAACLAATRHLADLPAPAAAPAAVPVEVDPTAPPPPAPSVYAAAPTASALAASARACLRASADYLDHNPDGDSQITFAAVLAGAITTGLLHERDGLGKRWPAYVPRALNLAQSASHLARQHRRLDPRLALPGLH